MSSGGNGQGLAQDATLQRILLKLGLPTPQGGNGEGLAQDATLQKLLTAIVGGAASNIFVFQPGGTAGGNIFTSFSSLYTALSATSGPKWLLVDDTISSPAVIPAGAYDLRNVTFMGVANINNATGGAALSISAGVTFTPGWMSFDEAIDITSAATTPLITVGSGVECNIFMARLATIQMTSTGAFIEVQNGGFAFVFVEDSASLGDGTHAALKCDAGGGIGLNVYSGVLAGNALTGTMAQVAIAFDSSADIGGPQPAGITFIARGSYATLKQFGATGNNTTDDSGALQAAVSTLAGTGIPLLITGPASYLLSHPTDIPAGKSLRIVGSASAELNANLGVLGVPENAIFVTGATLGTASTSLHGANVQGTNTVDVHSLLSGANTIGAGTSIVIQSVATPLRAMTYLVTHVAGGADPFVLTLDRPVLYQFADGDTVTPALEVPEDIVIDGGGMQFVGTCDRFMEISGARRCEVRDCVFAPSGASDICASYDVSGYENRFVRCFVDGDAVGGTSSGLALETQDSSSIEECAVRNVAGNGLTMYDCVNCEFVGCPVGNCGQDGQVITCDGNTIGSFGCRIIGGSANECVHGVLIDNGSSFCKVVATNCDYCSTYGLYVTPTGNPTANSLVSVSARFSAGSGIVAAGKHTTIIDADVDSPASAGLLIDNDCMVDGIRMTVSGVTVGIAVQTASQVRIRGMNMGWTGGTLFTDVAGARTVITDSYATCGTGTRPGIVVSGVVSVSDTFIDSASIGIHVLAGGTARIAQNVSLDTCTAKITVDAGGYCNRKQTVVANGTTGVAVAWPDLKSTDVVLFTMQTPSGAFGDPKYTITPGTGFTFTSTAATDLGTYEYFIP